MSLTGGRAKLTSSLKELQIRWKRVGARWDDPVRRKFEEEFLAPLDGKVRATVSAMEEMYEHVARARRDCE